MLLRISILRPSSGSAKCSLLKLYINYFVIFIDDVAGYPVFVYMLYPLQESRSTTSRPTCLHLEDLAVDGILILKLKFKD
jgi:hypothetical protein